MNIFQQFFSSIYSPQTVATFRLQGIGKTILYVFVLMLITTALGMYQSASGLSSFVKEFEDTLKTKLPDFEVKNGLLVSAFDEPQYIHEPDRTIILDSTGTVTAEEVREQYEEAIALLKGELVFTSENISESFPYRDFGSLNLTKQGIEEIIASVADLLPLIIIIFVIIYFLFFTALKFLGIFFLTLFGISMKRKSEASLSYKQVWILSAYAVTLPTVFFTVTDALRIVIPYAFVLYWAVAVIMLYLIFKEIPIPIASDEDDNSVSNKNE